MKKILPLLLLGAAPAVAQICDTPEISGCPGTRERCQAFAVYTGGENMRINGTMTEDVWADIAATCTYDTPYNTWAEDIDFGAIPDQSAKPAPSNNSMTWMAAWDEDNLYLFVMVVDDVPTSTNQQNVEVFIDADDSGGFGTAWNDPAQDGVNDWQIILPYDTNLGWEPGLYDPRGSVFGEAVPDFEVEYAVADTDEGFNMEIRLSWEGMLRDGFGGLWFEPEQGVSGNFIKFDIKSSDSDDGEARSSVVGWCNPGNENYNSPGLFGYLDLIDSPPCGETETCGTSILETIWPAAEYPRTGEAFMAENGLGWFTDLSTDQNCNWHWSWSFGSSFGAGTFAYFYGGSARTAGEGGHYLYLLENGYTIWSSDNYGGWYYAFPPAAPGDLGGWYQLPEIAPLQ